MFGAFVMVVLLFIVSGLGALNEISRGRFGVFGCLFLMVSPVFLLFVMPFFARH